MIKHLLATLLLTTIALADSTVTINAGGGADYSSIAAAITGEAAATGAVVFNLEGSTEDTTAVNITGMSFTTLTIQSSTSTRYRLNTTDYWNNFLVNQSGVTLKDFDIIKSGSGAKEINILKANAANLDSLTLDGMKIAREGTWTSDGGLGAILILPSTSATGDFIVRNTFVDNCFGHGIYYGGQSSSESVYIHNNTVRGCSGNGIHTELNNASPATLELINNLATGNGTDYSLALTPDTSTTNLSSDATSPQTGLRSKTISFDTAPSLAAGDTDAIDAGTTIAAFSTDYDGDTRPSGAAWDIGADEYLSAGGSGAAERRRRMFTQ